VISERRPHRILTVALLSSLIPATAAVGMASTAPLPTPARRTIQVAEDGPDRARRADEDQRIAAAMSAQDPIAACEAQLAAASAAVRLDLPPRIRTRLWWTPVPADLAARAAEVAERARSLANASFSQLLGSTHPAVERLQAEAAVMLAVADTLSARASGDMSESWTDRLAAFRKKAADGPDRTSALDGPTLLLLAAGSLATPAEGATAADAFHKRAGTVPEGIDALEYALVGSLIEAGGIDPARRRTATADLLESPQSAPDRLLLGAIHADAAIELGRTPAVAIEETLRVMLPNRGVDAADRVRVVRAFAQIADASVSPDTQVADLPPLVALARLAPIVASADASALQRGPAVALIERATTSTSSDVRAEAWLDAATIRMRGGDAPGALDAIIAAIESASKHPKAEAAGGLAMRLAERIDDRTAFDEAVARLLAALPDHPQRHRWGLMRGDRALASGDRTAARAAWSAIPLTADVGVDAGLRVLDLDAERLDGSTASTVLQTLDELDPRIPDSVSDANRCQADLLRIRCLVAMDRTTSAAEVAARFLDVASVPETHRLDVAAIALPTLEAATRTADADRLRTALAAIDPTLAARAGGDQLRRDHGAVMTAIDRDARDDARRSATSALDRAGLDPGRAAREAAAQPETALQIGWLLAAAGRADEAETIADAVVAAHPDGLEGLYLQAVLQGGRLNSVGRTRAVPGDDDAAAAIRTLSRINAGSGRGSLWWWRSELEKLEILAALRRDLTKIDARLERLETEFSDLGGPAFERRARALRASIQAGRLRE
jgi:tetratricopeptide (TPR) repeat protein